MRSPIVAFCLAMVLVADATGQDGGREVTVEEVVTLLKVGVPAGAVLDLVQRRGAEGLATEAQLAKAKRLGAAPDLLDLLAHRTNRIRAIRELAARYERYDLPDSRLRLLVPVKWTRVLRRHSHGSLLLLRPEGAVSKRWMETPTVFLLQIKGTPWPASASKEAATKVAEILLHHVVRHRVPVRLRREADGRLGGPLVPQWRLEVRDPERRYDGTLVFRTRIWADGSLSIIGFAAGVGADDLPRRILDDIARSTAVSF